MSLTRSFQVASTGLSSQSLRLNAIASNLANAEAVSGPDGQPYKPLVYKPGHPSADASGYVRMPNVNPVEAMVDMISASRSYQMNVEMLNTSKQLMLKLLDLGRV
jgi:flagellar basal-body rod protein FlgC